MNHFSWRLDRFLTLLFFHPIKKIFFLKEAINVPILMYHSISNERTARAHAYYETSTTAKIFAEHMEFLYDNGYFTLNSQELLAGIDNKTKKNKKPVVITFDDGFKDFLTEAFPVINKYGFSAAVFLVTAFIGNNPIKFKGKHCLTWKEIRELRKNGILFGSHTVNHLKLYGMKKEQVLFEIGKSKEKIEGEIGEKIDTFSYPFAFPEQDLQFKNYLKKLLQYFDYKCCLTTTVGTFNGKENFFLKRIPISHYDDISLFKAKLESGYNWISNFQYLFKSLKMRLSN